MPPFPRLSLLLAVLLLLAGSSGAQPRPGVPPPAPSDPADRPVTIPGDLSLRVDEQAPAPLASLMGTGYKLLVFMKPWCPETPRVVETYSQYKHRLNKEPLATALVFVNTRAEEAREASRNGEAGLKVLLDDGGRVARQLKVRTVPSLILISPSNQVIFRTAYLSDFLIRQIANDYENPAALKDARENRWAIPGVPGFGAQGP